MTKKLLSPGQKSPVSGQIKQVGPRGGQASTTESTIVKNKPLPPTSKQGNKWIVVDKTKHKENK